MGKYWLVSEDYLMPVPMLCCVVSGINNAHPTSSLLSHQTLEWRATVCGVTEIDKQPTLSQPWHGLSFRITDCLSVMTFHSRRHSVVIYAIKAFLMGWISDEGSFAKVTVLVECRMINSGVTLSLMSARCANPTKIENFSSLLQSVPGPF